MSAPNKISPHHLSRKAMVYVRQSTMAQVREHTESTARQYALVEEAARLGWAAARIDVIDCDLGLSGRSAEHRSGFRDLVSRVCLGEVGAIFGLEVSRLARSSADLARLLELARLTDTLIIDADGIYDLRDFNDRLLLGLKRPVAYSTSCSTSLSRSGRRHNRSRCRLAGAQRRGTHSRAVLPTRPSN
jgi:DNA invertase Pin-like site-specific DNA recombinase